MDIRKTAGEIGLFETAINLAKVSDSAEVLEKIGNTFPLPSKSISDNLKEAAKWLLSFSKKKYVFFTPEIALAEAMGEMDPDIEILFAIPCGMDAEAKERLLSNLPKNICAGVFEEPYFPEIFPSNAMCVACGYMGMERVMVLPDTYRLVEHYSGFKGKKAFIPYVELESARRYEGWMELSAQRINMKWRRNNE